MRLLIIGGNRFLGAELVARAVIAGHDVTVLALDPPRADVRPHVRFRRADRNDPAALTRALRGRSFDAVIDNIAFDGPDVTGLHAVLGDRLGRYVVTSSVDTYRNALPLLCDEVTDEVLTPAGREGAPKAEQYLRGKRACELAVRALGIPWSVVRPAIVVGRNDPLAASPTSLSHGAGTGARGLFFPLRVADGGPILLRDDDERLFSSVWVQDVAAALLVAATHPDAAGHAFNAVGDEVWTSERLVRSLGRAGGREVELVRVSVAELEAAGLADYEPPYGRATHFSLSSNARLKRLGWRPTPAADWLPKLLERLEAPLDRPFATRRFQEIALARTLIARAHLPRVTAAPSTPPRPPLLGGHHSADASAAYAEEILRRESPPDATHFRYFGDAVVSSIGLGTYAGEPGDDDDALYFESIRHAIRGGLNLIDTAISYRRMASERVVGKALRSLAAEGLSRDAICVVTKGGFLPSDAADPRSPDAWVQEELVATGLVSTAEARARHAIAPAFIDWAVRRSLSNLGLSRVDLYLLHNPERALEALGVEAFERRLVETFACLEQHVSAGRIGAFGIATWAALRSPPGHAQHLELERIVALAREAAGAGPSHLAAVELPYSAAQPEAATLGTQRLDGRDVSAFEAANALGLFVLSSASVMRAGAVTEEIRARLPVIPAPPGAPAASLQLARSHPAVGCALAGMRRVAHVEEAIAVARLSTLRRED